jgi:hypothetical protein
MHELKETQPLGLTRKGGDRGGRGRPSRFASIADAPTSESEIRQAWGSRFELTTPRAKLPFAVTEVGQQFYKDSRSRIVDARNSCPVSACDELGQTRSVLCLGARH